MLCRFTFKQLRIEKNLIKLRIDNVDDAPFTPGESMHKTNCPYLPMTIDGPQQLKLNAEI